MADVEVFELSAARPEVAARAVEHPAFQAMRENYPNDTLLAAVAGPNLDLTDEEECPSGLVAVHPADAIVNPDSIREEMFQYVAVAQLPEGRTYDEQALKGKAAEFDAAIPQYSERSPSLTLRDPVHNGDLERWAPELGEGNAHVGLYVATRPDGRTRDYYLVARAGAPLACRELRRSLLGRELTFAQLRDDPEANYVRSVAQRNAQRLLYNAARALCVPVRQCDDVSAYIPPHEEHAAPPKRAEPDYLQSVHTVASLVHGGRDAVGVFNGVTPLNECNRMGARHFFVLGSPYEGLYMYPMEGYARGLGLPVDTGRRAAFTPNRAEAERRANTGIMWEPEAHLVAPEARYHPALEPEAAHEVDAHFERALERQGWDRARRRTHLVPLLLKLSNPALMRK